MELQELTFKCNEIHAIENNIKYFNEKNIKKICLPPTSCSHLCSFIKLIIKMKIKNILFVLLAIISVSVLTSCSSSDKKPKKVIVIKESDIVRENIGVNGMTCVGCEVTLEDNISKIEGVVSVKASHTNKDAIIEFDSTKTDINTITKTIRESGYEPFNK